MRNCNDRQKKRECETNCDRKCPRLCCSYYMQDVCLFRARGRFGIWHEFLKSLGPTAFHPHFDTLPVIQGRANIEVERQVGGRAWTVPSVKINDVARPNTTAIYNPIMPVERG